MSRTITHLWTQPYGLELRSSLSWGQGHRLETLNHVLVRVELSDGATGFAEAPPRPTIYGETAESIAAIIAQDCSTLLLGQPIDSLEDIHAAQQRLTLVKNNPTARGALDMALHMALAQAQGKTLAELLASSKQRVQVSFILGTGSDQVVMDEVQWVYEAGVRVLKVKIGKDFAREKAQIQAIRQQYPAMTLYADGNQCYTAEEARRYLPELADLDLRWCEEPLPVQQIRARAELRREEIMPVIADDSAFSLPDLERELDFDTFDVLNLKTARNGFSEASAMLSLCQQQVKGVMVGSQAGSLLGCLHALIFSAQAGIDYPTEASFFLKVKDGAEGPPIRDGYIDLAEAQALLDKFAFA